MKLVPFILFFLKKKEEKLVVPKNIFFGKETKCIFWERKCIFNFCEKQAAIKKSLFKKKGTAKKRTTSRDKKSFKDK
jgi:hypothetical protein